jgi:hypothetical protein
VFGAPPLVDNLFFTREEVEYLSRVRPALLQELGLTEKAIVEDRPPKNACQPKRNPRIRQPKQGQFHP